MAAESLAQNETKTAPGKFISKIATGTSVAGRKQIVSKFQRHPKDVGSPEVQVALLTDRLSVLSRHAAQFPQDVHTQRGMLRVISRRKGLLQYLKDTDVARYRKLIGDLGLRK